ncbi:MAG: hypothetical protein KY476_26560, partial [Planctomycetes bacterium]|nr:hypothetical protein [Planctomycetota bacterium]
GVPAGDDPACGLYVIDLGRAARKRRLSRHWIVKDLAQFCFSARRLGVDLPPQFFERWLGRATSATDARLLRAVERKSWSIERHSRKNAL